MVEYDRQRLAWEAEEDQRREDKSVDMSAASTKSK
jgi:hypothetical protein